MPKICLIKPAEVYFNYDDCSKIIDKISDWEEVSIEELNLLKRFVSKYNYVIIEYVEKQRDLIDKGIKAALEEARIEDEKEKERKESAEKKKLERELKKRAKDEKAEKALLEQLEKKYREKNNG